MEDNQLVDFTEAYAMVMHKLYETLNKKEDLQRIYEFMMGRGETNGAVRAFGAAGSEWSAVCIDEGVYRFRRGYGGGTSGRMRPAS